MRVPFLLGRLLFGGFFVMNGINHFKQARQLSDYAASKRVPKPDLAVKATAAVLTGGGLSVLLGVKPKLGAAVILGFLAGASPIIDDFWKAEQADQRMNDTVNFMKNMALAGGAMALMAVEEPWPASMRITRKPAGGLRRLLRKVAA